MRILVAAPAFPSAAHPFAGIFSAAIAATLRDLGNDVVMLAPRPFAPPGITRFRRWRHYGGIEKLGTYDGVEVHRPSTIVIPGFCQAFWADWAAWFGSKRYVGALHRKAAFDTILGLDLGGAGGLAWRLGKTLGIPAAGWAFGSEVRVDASTDHGRSVSAAINQLDIVFYQSAELRECASDLVGRDLSADADAQRHRVLPHGIRQDSAASPTASTSSSSTATSAPEPSNPSPSLRESWGVAPDQRIILSLGRLLRSKGVFELLDAFEAIASEKPDVMLVVIGGLPPRDDTEEFQRAIEARGLGNRVLVKPPIDPTLVQSALRSADVFAFTSYLEGMPNVVLEALFAEVPIVAFDIPPLREADPDASALALVAKGDALALRVEICRAMDDSSERSRRTRAGALLVRERFDMQRNLRSALDIISGRPKLAHRASGASLPAGR